jgi:hypothetical protein
MVVLVLSFPGTQACALPRKDFFRQLLSREK